MIRFLLRLLGLIVLAAAFVALIRDGMRTIAGTTLFFRELRGDLNDINPSILEGLQRVAERYADWLWNPVIQTIVERPTCLVFGILGAVLVLLGRKKKPLIGYGRD